MTSLLPQDVLGIIFKHASTLEFQARFVQRAREARLREGPHFVYSIDSCGLTSKLMHKLVWGLCEEVDFTVLKHFLPSETFGKISSLASRLLRVTIDASSHIHEEVTRDWVRSILACLAGVASLRSVTFFDFAHDYTPPDAWGSAEPDSNEMLPFQHLTQLDRLNYSGPFMWVDQIKTLTNLTSLQLNHTIVQNGIY